MEKRIIITFNAEELKELLGLEIVGNFDTYMNLTDNIELFDLDSQEQLLKDIVLTNHKRLFDEGFSGCYPRIYAGGLAPEFRSNQKLLGKITFIYPENVMF